MSAEVSIRSPFSRDPAQRLRQRPKHQRHHKHRNSLQTAQPKQTQDTKSSFLDHLFALPGELRLEIHRRILVRPCKFNVRHRDTCDGKPFFLPFFYTFRNTNIVLRCANCCIEPWGHCHMERASDSPARSQWARPKKNPYFCDECYADKQIEFGFERCPDLKGIQCLCARHDGLGWLLANRRIYEEASPIFWKENTFGFENGRLLYDFLEKIPSEKREMIRSISFRSPYDDEFMEIEEVARCWPLLRECSGLRELELDARFLDDFACVLGLNTITVRNVRFVQMGPLENFREQNLLRFIWPLASNRGAYSDQLGDKLSASMIRAPVDEEYLRQEFQKRERLKQLA